MENNDPVNERLAEQVYVAESVNAAQSLAIKEIQDCYAGQIREAQDLLPRNSESLHLRRREIEKAKQDGTPLYRCAYCSRPVYLSLGSFERLSGLHFRHYQEDGDCIARTRTGRTKEQIDALKYDGLKEGALHRETKELLVASLKADPLFSEIEVETRWTNNEDGEWRQPDVRALFGHQRVAFEVQLATTFLSVIEARARFYLREGIRLIWVFRSFETENRAAAIDDIYFGNNRNAFVISPDTCNTSIATQTMMLRCYWPQPELRGSNIVEIWKEQLVPFSALQADQAGREWFFDCDKHRQNLLLEKLRRQTRSFCVSWDDLPFDVRDLRWRELVDSAFSLGFDLSGTGVDHRFRKLMSALFSLEEGKPVGFGFPWLISVAHHIFDKHKPLLYYFMHGENAYGRRQQLLNAGTPGVWAKRREEARAQMRVSGNYSPDKRHDFLVRSFFPAVAGEMDRRKAK